MKIIIVGPAYPYRGGIADTNESLCRALNNLGHDSSIITFSFQYPAFLFPGKTQYSEDPHPQDIKIISKIHSINPINWVTTASYISKQNPDLVVFRYWLPFLSPCLGSIARLLNKKIKKVALCDNVLPHEARFGDRQLTKYFINAFDGFMTLSEKVQDELQVFTQKPMAFFPHPINDNLGLKIDKLTARDYLNVTHSGNYILFFGLIRKYKGLDLLLEALGDSRLKTMDIKLIVAGEFYDDPAEYMAIIDKYKLRDRVKIVDQFIPTEEIKYYFSAVDMVAQTYRSASQSGVTQIAYNFEVPILVTDVGGLSETIRHGDVGYVSKLEPVQIASCIEDFYIHNRSEQFIANIKIEKKKYTWTAFGERLIDLFEQLKLS